MNYSDDEDWIEVKSKRKHNKASSRQLPQTRQIRNRESFIHSNQKVNSENVKEVEANINLWMKFAMDGNIEEMVNKKLENLRKSCNGNIGKLWDCIFNEFKGDNFENSSKFKDHVYSLNTDSDNENRDQIALKYLSSKYKLEIRICSLNENMKDMIVGERYSNSIDLLHIGLEWFIPLTIVESPKKYLFSREDKNRMHEINVIKKDKSVKVLKHQKEKGNLHKIRKMLKGLEKKEEIISIPKGQMNRFYDIHTQEELINMDNLQLCKLNIINPNQGEAIPLVKQPAVNYKHIKLTSRKNCGYNAFQNDIVYVEIHDPINGTGKVMGVHESYHKPVNNLYICRVSRDQGNLMIPLDKSFPKIHVDNEPGRQYYKQNDITTYVKNSVGISPQQKSIVDLQKESLKYGNNLYYSVFKVSVDDIRRKPLFTYPKVTKFNPETCENLFLVCYEYWDVCHMYPSGKIVGVLSTFDSLNENFHLITALCNVDTIDDTENYLEEINRISNEVKSIINAPNTYLPTDAVIFTIDSEHTMDMDDAISYHKNDKNIVIGVHISDVTKFISPSDKIYRHAQERFSSLYPPKFSKIPPIHLLGDALATDILSLVPNEQRAVLSVLFIFNKDMQMNNFQLCDIVRPTFHKGFIVSQHKLNYEDVSSWIRTSYAPQNVDKNLLTALNETYKISTKLRQARLPESYFVRGTSSYYKDFQIDNQFEAKILIEELMILTNEYTARKIYEYFPNFTLLRTQESVKNHSIWSEKLVRHTNLNFTAELMNYCNLVCPTPSNQNPSKNLVISERFFCKFCELLATDAEKAKQLLQCEVFYNDFFMHISEWHKINNKSQYLCSVEDDAEINRHFSLNKSLYTHFTSPIRRFADIVVHRLLKSVINSETETCIPDNIDELCNLANKKAKDNEKLSKILNTYVILNETERRHCFILDCTCSEITEEELHFVYPLLKDVYSVNRIRFSNMSLKSVPRFELHAKDIFKCTLHWKKLIFSVTDSNETSTKNKFIIDSNLYELHLPCSSAALFKSIRQSSESGTALQTNLNALKSEFKKSDYREIVSSDSVSIADPFIEIELCISIKNIMRIQFCKYKVNGLQTINPELFIITETFQLCLIHHDDPTKYFVPGGNIEFKYNDIKEQFKTIEEYKAYFEPLLQIESLSETLSEKPMFHLFNVSITWIVSYFPVTQCRERYGIILLPRGIYDLRNMEFGQETEKIFDKYEHLINEGISSIGGDLVCLRYKQPNWKNYWVGHGEVVHAGKFRENKDNIKLVIFRLTQSDYDLFSYNIRNGYYLVDVYRKPVVTQNQQNVVASIQDNRFLTNVILGTEERSNEINEDEFEYLMNKTEKEIKKKLNECQKKAIKNALIYKLSLIWGPPGTGKTNIGCIISYIYSNINRNRNNNGTVFYCGPSNESVNLVSIAMADMFLNNCPRMLRIFGKQQELGDFPLPGYSSKNHLILSNEIKEISLHHLIRNEKGELGDKLRELDKLFENILKFPQHNNTGQNVCETIHDAIVEYKETLKKAKIAFIKKHPYDIVLCTTSVTAKPILNLFNTTQIIIDEAGMCKEPETLLPISRSSDSVENVVLIGDHKQLRPIILSRVANKNGLQISLFERYQKLKPKLVTMLNYQYRMHPSICEFPSKQFYRGRLKTQMSKLWSGLTAEEFKGYGNYLKFYYKKWNGLDYEYAQCQYTDVLRSLNYTAISNEIWPGKRVNPYTCFDRKFSLYPERIVFIHIVGDEVNQCVKTGTGNENSKGNPVEVEVVANIYGKVIARCEPPRQASNFITVLTQYRHQQDLLQIRCKEVLKSQKIKLDPIVKTVISSQGSQNEYIIFSTVRSIRNIKDIIKNPSPGWERQYLGFITDPNQVNVALTRAQKGLIIIGNKELLRVNKMWGRIIQDLESRNCIANYLEFLSRFDQ